ncbi:hypothetical protein OG357_35395 [Streptomyces sp. NBC_01255]|uniref:hypothetical protein n=1 Tax=Streptomyces sp. NBC_01255 TaxID=2903798 RepID=UPI002E329916|nr:hypothetical protein [Streptomyces sp. NBC_01255]
MSRMRAALDGASSPMWLRRVRAGQQLAPFADVPAAAEALVGLPLDPEDTAVTLQTAEGLMRVGTVDSAPGLAEVCGQLAVDREADVRRGATQVLACWVEIAR